MNNDELILKMLTEIKQSMPYLEGNISNLESDVKDIKKDVKKLHKSDDLILDEIERVHEIFDRKYNELKAKIV